MTNAEWNAKGGGKEKALEELVKDYDNILYLDLDVVVNTNKNFFKKFDMNTICCKSFYSSLYNEYGLKNSDYNHISNDIENEIKNLDSDL